MAKWSKTQDSHPPPLLLRYGLLEHRTCIDHSEVVQRTGVSFKFNQSINRHHHRKDHIEIGHLTKFEGFRINRAKLWTFKHGSNSIIFINVSNLETAFRQIILTLFYRAGHEPSTVLALPLVLWLCW